MSLETDFDKVRTEARSVRDSERIDRAKIEEVIRNADRAETRHSGEQGNVQAKQLTADLKYGAKTAFNVLTVPFGFRKAIERQEKFSNQHDESSDKNYSAQVKSEWRAKLKLEELKFDLASARNTQSSPKDEIELPKSNKNSVA